MIVCLGRRVISGAGVTPFAIKLISSHRRQHIPRTFYPFVSPLCARSFSIPKGTQQKKDNEESKPKIPNQSVWEQLKSPPNVITLTRMVSTPILAHLIVSEEYTLAIGGCILAGLSDALDGFLAKNYKMETIVGSYLDPISDKVLINGLALSLWHSGILPTPLLLVWGTKDFGLLIGGAWTLYKKYNSINFFITSLYDQPLIIQPSNIAKINTALQFTTIWVGIITPVTSLPPMMLHVLCWITGATTVGSVLSYATTSGISIKANNRNSDR